MIFVILCGPTFCMPYNLVKLYKKQVQVSYNFNIVDYIKRKVDFVQAHISFLRPIAYRCFFETLSTAKLSIGLGLFGSGSGRVWAGFELRF